MTVTLKSHGDGINIILDSLADFSTVSNDLRAKVAGARQFFEGTSTNVSFLGRGLLPEEEQTLLDIITTETTMSVTLVDYMAPKEPPAREKKEKPAAKPALPPVPEPEPPPITSRVPSTPQPTMPHTETNTAYYQISLRSGQSIRFKGSVVVLGDANPGSEIIADGNVIVLGALKGMAHAGAAGDASCFVSALALLPTQLRISNIITYVPQPARGKKEVPKPSIAYVKDGQVFVGPL